MSDDPQNDRFAACVEFIMKHMVERQYQGVVLTSFVGSQRLSVIANGASRKELVTFLRVAADMVEARDPGVWVSSTSDGVMLDVIDDDRDGSAARGDRVSPAAKPKPDSNN